MSTMKKKKRRLALIVLSTTNVFYVAWLLVPPSPKKSVVFKGNVQVIRRLKFTFSSEQSLEVAWRLDAMLTV